MTLKADRDDFKMRLGECQASRDAAVRRFEVAERQLYRLREAVRPILAAYRSGPAYIAEEQITAAWTAFDDCSTPETRLPDR